MNFCSDRPAHWVTAVAGSDQRALSRIKSSQPDRPQDNPRLGAGGDFMGKLSKFDELRLKTDKELVLLLNNDVELGLAAARAALNCIDDLSSAVRNYAKAKKSHAEVSRLLPLAYEIASDERARLELRLDQLARMLETLQSLDSGIHPAKEDAFGF